MENDESASAPPPPPQWVSLPEDIVTTVYRRLNTYISLLRLRAVCSSWRFSLPLSLSPISPFPLVLPSPSAVFQHHPSPPTHIKISHSTILSLSPLSSSSPSSSFLLMLSVSNASTNSFSLHNPLSTTKLKPLPNPINLLDFRISEIATTFHLTAGELRNGGEGWTSILIRKLVVLTDLTVLLLSYGGKLVKLRYGDQEWTSILGNTGFKMDCYYHFHDLIWVRNQCYAVNASGILMKFDSEVNPVELTSSLGCSSREQKYLVPSSNGDDLYLVTKISDPDPEFYYDYSDDEYVLDHESFGMPIKMTVFKLNWGKGFWDCVGRSGNEVFFLGDDVSFMISASDFDGCRANSIFLTDECFCSGDNDDDEEDNVYGEDTGVYALDLRSTERLADNIDLAKLFWPPPSWLMQ